MNVVDELLPVLCLQLNNRLDQLLHVSANLHLEVDLLLVVVLSVNNKLISEVFDGLGHHYLGLMLHKRIAFAFKFLFTSLG
jgi:hypothetical protein